jgi:hypothetical protein
VVVDAPPTQGIKHAGSKLKLLPRVLTIISKVRRGSVLDRFMGTTRVSQALDGVGGVDHLTEVRGIVEERRKTSSVVLPCLDFVSSMVALNNCELAR